MDNLQESDRYTLVYRATETQQVMGWIKAGQSGCVIGFHGVGRSNFLHYLLRQDIRRHYLGQNYADFAFVLIDLLALTERTDWAIYELILNRLLTQLHPLGIEAETIGEVSSLHREAMRLKDPLTAYRALERCMNALCRQPSRRVVLLFDEFDAVFQALDPFLFRCLRAVRDAHRGQVAYIVLAANDLARLRDDLAKAEHFDQLVSRNVCGLKPYSKKDAQQMIRYLISQRPVELSEEDTSRLIELSGGHAGLIVAVLSLLWDARYESDLVKLAPILRDEAVVQAECRRIWSSLPDNEQTTLYALARERQVDPHIHHHLKFKGLVKEVQPRASLFSPLFADFVRQQATPLVGDTIVSHSPPLVQIEGRPVEDLTELEFEMLCYLHAHRGQVCTKDELIENVYRQQYARMSGGVTDAALQTLISRLREKIEPNREQPCYVVTIRGEGYKFVEPDNEDETES